MKIVLLMFLLGVLSLPVRAQQSGCQYDSQCKGSRVCESGRCVADRGDDPFDSDNGSHDPQRKGFPSNTPVRQCGCNGVANFRQEFPSGVCASGVEVALPCQFACPGTGMAAWGTVCK